MSIRTDLAVEAHELMRGDAKEIEGVAVERTEHDGIRKIVVEITSEAGAEKLGKRTGRYVTIEAPDIRYELDDYERVCKMIADEIRRMCKSTRVLVAGLGNRDITPDALGAEAVSQLIVTSHIKNKLPDVLDDNYGIVSAIAPGVMGTTGIETSEIIRGVAEKVRPEAIIAIDALAGADIDRICSVVQISDAGISPGSGVGNNRAGINRESFGVPVIAIGVPTVIAAELLTGKELPTEFEPLMVTTKDIDLVIKRMSKTVANGINMAMHRNLTFKDIERIVD
ncbi:MAG: GPR endopeptidase [Clostridia bacterium]|nr:GPR endopeptidase [Clostridia bacterium]